MLSRQDLHSFPSPCDELNVLGCLDSDHAVHSPTFTHAQRCPQHTKSNISGVRMSVVLIDITAIVAHCLQAEHSCHYRGYKFRDQAKWLPVLHRALSGCKTCQSLSFPAIHSCYSWRHRPDGKSYIYPRESQAPETH